MDSSDDLNEQLQKYQQECNEFYNKKFGNFYDYEAEACRLINEGTSIREHLKNNPDLCDKNSYAVLTNQAQDLSLLSENLKPLEGILRIKHKLLESYEEFLKHLTMIEDYQNMIKILNQMYNFTYSPHIKVKIAEIYIRDLDNPQESLKYYNEVLPLYKNDIVFLWGIATAFEGCKMYKKALLCMKRAMQIELKEIDPDMEPLNV